MKLLLNRLSVYATFDIEMAQKNWPTSQIMPHMYEGLRRLAHHKMQGELPGQTLSATGLLHETYLRLKKGKGEGWDGPAHFYTAAAETMRRILVERARRRNRLRHGAGLARIASEPDELDSIKLPEELLDLDEALTSLERLDPHKASIVKLRYFAGFTIIEVAEILEVSRTSIKRDWAYARAFLQRAISSARS